MDGSPNIHHDRPRDARLVALSLAALGIVYGDIGTSPLYAIRECFHGKYGLPAFTHLTVPITIVILIVLFMFQRQGTSTIGALFGPVMILWFLVLAATGVAGIVRDPSVLAAINPLHGIDFLMRNRLHGYLVLSAVFLTVTGAEALYADLGHFGARPIRLTWFVVVLPALLLNYFGQGAVLLTATDVSTHPFFALVPRWALLPLVLLATAATIIASQAVISGAFSLTSQSIQLGYLPRMRIIHTSESVPGQIYVPAVNWGLVPAGHRPDPVCCNANLAAGAPVPCVPLE